MAIKKDQEKKAKAGQEQKTVDKAAAAADNDQAQSASSAAIVKAGEAIKKATAAVQAAGQSQSEQATETESAVSAATAAASAAKAASEAAEAASAVAAEVTEGKTATAPIKRKKTIDKVKRWLDLVRQLVLIIASLVLLYYLTEDMIHHGIPIDTTNKFLEVQFWICIIFIVDIVCGFFLTHDIRRYFLNTWLFLVVSIPYLPIIKWYGIHVGVEFEFVLKLVPLIRGGFALAVVLGWLIYDKASTLFVTYLTVLIATVYLSSVAFYTSEHGINPLVTDYSDALWWACMDVTTVGCNIEAMTLTGKVLSVFVAAMGIMMLPLFTVYITSLLAKKPDFNF